MQLTEENRRRDRNTAEYELVDTGVFDQDRYFDVEVEYAKAAADDMLIRISVTNRGPRAANLDVLPTLCFRNTWSWGYDATRPRLSEPIRRRVATAEESRETVIQADHQKLGTYWLICESCAAGPQLLFTDNDTNHARLLPGIDNPATFA